MRVILRFFSFLLRTAVLLAGLFLGFVGVATLQEGTGPPPPLLLGGSAVLLIVWWRLRGRNPRGDGQAMLPATILRIWQDPRPGAPGIHWTYVLFDGRGERVRVHLSKSQARRFLDRHGPGDVGRLTFSGEKLISWEPATADRPVGAPGVRAFISYERSWSDDARYVAQFLQSRGIDAWIDSGELRAGDRLGKNVEDAIAAADVFVPLLSRAYWTSAWCLRELEAARGRGVPIRPIKVEEGRLIAPPHMRTTAAAIVDEAVYLDLRGRDPIAQLDDFARAIGTAVRHPSGRGSGRYG